MLWILLGLTIFLAVVWGFEELDRRRSKEHDETRS